VPGFSWRGRSETERASLKARERSAQVTTPASTQSFSSYRQRCHQAALHSVR
jgi:hypothetical protein